MRDAARTCDGPARNLDLSQGPIPVRLGPWPDPGYLQAPILTLDY
jgi:hypothetical protein